MRGLLLLDISLSLGLTGVIMGSALLTFRHTIDDMGCRRPRII